MEFYAGSYLEKIFTIVKHCVTIRRGTRGFILCKKIHYFGHHKNRCTEYGLAMTDKTKTL